MTKEPKLEGAVRIVKEWVALDEEATAATQRAYDELMAASNSSSDRARFQETVDQNLQLDTRTRDQPTTPDDVEHTEL